MKQYKFYFMLNKICIVFKKVEPQGIEPWSKQAIKELSTRLVFVWFFVIKLCQKQPLYTYPLKISNNFRGAIYSRFTFTIPFDKTP